LDDVEVGGFVPGSSTYDKLRAEMLCAVLLGKTLAQKNECVGSADVYGLRKKR
jgi:hypothetical protein